MQIYPNGIELIACYEQRDAMKKVARGMQNGGDIMNLFGSSGKKKRFSCCYQFQVCRSLCINNMILKLI